MKKNLLLTLTTILLLSCSKDSDNYSSQSTKGNPSFDGKVYTKTITIEGNLHNHNPTFASYKSDGPPNLCYYANSDNTIDIAWHDSLNSSINITKIDAKGTKINEFKLEGLPKVTNLRGFTKIPDGSYAVTYSTRSNFIWPKTNDFNVSEGTNEDIGKLHIAKFDASGNKVFNKTIFGDTPHLNKPLVDRRHNPSTSGRLEYSPSDDALIYFIAHNQRKGKGSRHQAGTFGLFDTDGNYITAKYWNISHNYDMRILFDQGTTYLFGHGDRGPYGLYVEAYQFPKVTNKDGGLRTDVKKLEEGGTYGYAWSKENKTNHALGDVVSLGNGKFIVAYTRGRKDWKRGNPGFYDVFIRNLDTKEGGLLDKGLEKAVKITDVAKDNEHNGCARIAKFGNNIIVGWHNNNKEKPYAFIGEYDLNGKTLVAPKMIDKVLLNSMYGLITLPNGNVFWASSSKNNDGTLYLNWIKK